MWKDWFYYSRSERRVIVLLLFVLVIFISFIFTSSPYDDKFVLEDNTLALVDSLSKKIENSKDNNLRNRYNNSQNTVDNNISKERIKIERTKRSDSVFVKYVNKKQEKFPEGTIIDVNTADTITLMKIPGIGKVISRNIINYRDRLGGFYSINQLLEVKYVEPSLLRWFKIETGVYRKLRINSDGIEILKKHPYMNYYRAKAIMDYRIKRGRIENISQLSFLKEFSDEDLEKLSQYIDFQ